MDQSHTDLTGRHIKTISSTGQYSTELVLKRPSLISDFILFQKKQYNNRQLATFTQDLVGVTCGIPPPGLSYRRVFLELRDNGVLYVIQGRKVRYNALIDALSSPGSVTSNSNYFEVAPVDPRLRYQAKLIFRYEEEAERFVEQATKIQLKVSQHDSSDDSETGT